MENWSGRYVQNRQMIYQENIYVFGGNNMNGERYCPIQNKWLEMSSYKHLI